MPHDAGRAIAQERGLATVSVASRWAQAGYLVKSTPLRRLTAPADLSDAVCFLASDRSRQVTGQLLNVSGGLPL